MEQSKRTRYIDKIKLPVILLVALVTTLAIGSCTNEDKKNVPSVFGETTDGEDVYLQSDTVKENKELQPIIEIADTVIDLGEIKKGINSTRIAKFKYYNKGNAPLIVQKIEAYCACTQAAFDKKPIDPGKHGLIEVTFDADLMVGRTFKKNLQVLSNAKNGPQLIKVSGTITY